VGSEAWREDLSDVILPLATYDTSSDESEGEARGGAQRCGDELADGDGAHSSAAAPEPWEATPPHRVLQLMRENEKHGHKRRGLHGKGRPPMSPEVAGVRRLDPAQAHEEFDDIVGGSDGKSTGEPVIVRGLVDGWRAKERWSSAEAFAEHYGDMPLKVHELVSVSGMGKGTELWLPARDYIEYAHTVDTDAPFYVFQKKFLPGHHAALFDDYSRPELFSEDLWDLTPELREGFSQNRFFCIGGERTGSALHVDPHFTGAWNALLCGEKRWVLFPPETPAEKIGVPTDLHDMLRTPAAYWWHDWYPRLTAPGGDAGRLGMREVVQRPGETIYVPAGWWHAVLNHGWTIAVTENQLSPPSLRRVWPQLKPDRRRARRLARALRRLRPDLFQVIASDDAEAEGDAASDGSEERGEGEDDDFRMW